MDLNKEEVEWLLKYASQQKRTCENILEAFGPALCSGNVEKFQASLKRWTKLESKLKYYLEGK